MCETVGWEGCVDGTNRVLTWIKLVTEVSGERKKRTGCMGILSLLLSAQ